MLSAAPSIAPGALPSSSASLAAGACQSAAGADGRSAAPSTATGTCRHPGDDDRLSAQTTTLGALPMHASADSLESARQTAVVPTSIATSMQPPSTRGPGVVQERCYATPMNGNASDQWTAPAELPPLAAFAARPSACDGASHPTVPTNASADVNHEKQVSLQNQWNKTMLLLHAAAPELAQWKRAEDKRIDDAFQELRDKYEWLGRENQRLRDQNQRQKDDRHDAPLPSAVDAAPHVGSSSMLALSPTSPPGPVIPIDTVAAKKQRWDAVMDEIHEGEPELVNWKREEELRMAADCKYLQGECERLEQENRRQMC